MTAVRHVLLDADGVMQHLPGGWVAALTPYLGARAASFLEVVLVDELPSLRGEDEFEPRLAARLAAYDAAASADEVFRSVWLDIAVVPESVALVRALRAQGYGVHLASNQTRRRAAYMVDELGYGQLFDRCFVSYQLGVAKPSAGYFERIVERLDADPSTLLFVDDVPANVAAARNVGLRAECWHLDEGHETLRARLRTHGVDGGDFTP